MKPYPLWLRILAITLFSLFWITSCGGGSGGSEESSSTESSFDDQIQLSNRIFNIELTPQTPANLKSNEYVNMSFQYETSNPDGVYISAEPYTDNSLTRDYIAHEPSLHPSGTGSSSGWFTIAKGGITVDRISISITDHEKLELLKELSIPVDYRFENAQDHVISNIQFSPRSPATLAPGKDIVVTFNYVTSQTDGVRIWAIPYTNGSISSAYSYQASGVHFDGSASLSRFFSITKPGVHVDEVRLLMTDANQTQTLFDTYISVDYGFENAPDHVISNIQFSPKSPDTLAPGKDIVVTFNYVTSHTDGVRIWAIPYTNGSISSAYSYQASGVHFDGSASMSRFFTVTKPGVHVDEVRLLMTDANQTQTLFDAYIPVDYGFENAQSNEDSVLSKQSKESDKLQYFYGAPLTPANKRGIGIKFNNIEDVSNNPKKVFFDVIN